MKEADEIKQISYKYAVLKDELNEKQKRRWAASEAIVRGHGGISDVANATGLDRKTIARGMQELKGPDESEDKERVRKPGGGRWALTDHDDG
jgi:DNA-binding phage protein